MPEWIPLSTAEELALIRAAQGGCIESRNRLIEHHLPLLLYTVKRYFKNQPVQTGEYLGVGMLGMLRAIRLYDPDRSMFSTFAVKAIRWALNGELRLERKKYGLYYTNHDFLESGSEPEPADFNGLSDALGPLVEALPDREREVIVSRMMGQTLNEIGKRLDLSKERVRQLEKKAQGTLKIRLAR